MRRKTIAQTIAPISDGILIGFMFMLAAGQNFYLTSIRETGGWRLVTAFFGVMFLVSEVARRAGVATSSIRYYERIGLLPEPDREGGQRRYDTEVLGKLGFIGVAQSAGFKLREIKQLINGVDGASGLGDQMRSLSSAKLDEVEELLERTRAMKGWLEVAKECGCATPAECALFPAPGEEPKDVDLALRVVRVGGKDCRRPPAG